MKDHAWELLPRPGVGYHPLSRKINEDKLWGTLLSRTVSEGYADLETMTVLYRQARDLSVLQKKYKDQIKSIEELPFEYRDALYRFRSWVSIARQDENCSTLEGCEGFGYDGLYLVFLMENLFKDYKYWARRFTLIDEIQRLLRTSSKVNGLISAHVYKALKPEQKKKKGQPSTNTDVSYLIRPVSNLFLDESEQATEKTVPSKRKAKIKTKGEPAKTENVVTPPVEAPEPEVVDKQPTFPVDARALKVFRALFYNPEITSSPGEIAWHDFLHAMTSTGFQAEKLYGSVWQFRPSALDFDRGIHFHEPHPKGKIGYRIARRHGRRLERAYGWHGGMFVLKGK
ncbi:hypothetical protein FAUST_1854 [Fusarium austroamericanum]|uniref:Uncharacterized protein n=1 Tax=Fusarium austroamericanum TaxID=282268 RepID=A0AAN6HJD8_FUSAU|nr:hypothetical protein FAUST_1854 [Fusarium austroamericanum]